MLVSALFTGSTARFRINVRIVRRVRVSVYAIRFVCRVVITITLDVLLVVRVTPPVEVTLPVILWVIVPVENERFSTGGRAVKRLADKSVSHLVVRLCLLVQSVLHVTVFVVVRSKHSFAVIPPVKVDPSLPPHTSVIRDAVQALKSDYRLPNLVHITKYTMLFHDS